MTGRPPGGASPASFPPPDPSQGRVAWLPKPSVLSPKQAPSAVRPPGLQGQQGRGPWRTELFLIGWTVSVSHRLKFHVSHWLDCRCVSLAGHLLCLAG